MTFKNLTPAQAALLAPHFKALASAYMAICEDTEGETMHEYLASLERLWPMSLDELSAELAHEWGNLEERAKEGIAA